MGKAGVIQEFNPAGTKDGNYWGRLLAFVARVARQKGASAAVAGHIATLRETASRTRQQVVPFIGPDTDGVGDPDSLNVSAFLKRIGVDESAAELLNSLPSDVLKAVINQFDPHGTKDGNMRARLEGYVRYQMKKRSGNAQEQVRSVRA